MVKDRKPATLKHAATKDILEDELRLLFENMISPFSYYRMVYDAEGKPIDYIFLAVNAAFEKETGKSRGEVIGRRAREVFPQTEQYWIELFGRVAKTSVAEEFTGYVSALDRWYNVRAYSPKPDHVAITILDISRSVYERMSLEKTAQELKEQQQENYRLAHEEPISGLPNRACLYEAFQSRFASGSESGSFALAIFAPDNLAEILASYGSVLSDKIMRALSQRIKNLCPEQDNVYSMTGTDLVMMIASSCETKRAKKVIAGIHQAIRKPIEIEGNTFAITVTCGVACYPKDGMDRDDLIMKANLALYQAKKSGLPTVYFNEQIAQKLIRRTMIRNQLHNALENKELEVYYQPQVETNSGCLLGFEALLRWNNAELGNPTPLEFIPVAEESRMILPIGEWVLRNACKTLRQLNERHRSNYNMAVNVSGVQLVEEGFINLVTSVLSETGLAPELLELEVTESVLLNREMNVIEKLNALRDLGVGIALDDFGTGYSSLAHLKDLEITTLKIDRSFIQDPRAGALTEMMVRLGHLLEAEIVAEGVETKEQLMFARVVGCERIQGFLEAHPMPLPDLRRYIEAKVCREE